MSKITNVKSTHMNWGPYVMKTKVPDYIIKKLKTEGKKAKESYNHALAGHLDNQFLYPQKIQEWFYNEIHPIIQAYRNGHCKFHGIEELNVDLRADDLWVNFMEAGDFNPVHTHGGDYSFVLFLDVPKQLKKEQDKFEGTSSPPGDMFMFPALLQHWVCPFKSKVTRISVSSNLRIINKENLPSDYF